MLSVADNEKLTKVGPGTPMGNLMRRYWQPVLLAREVADNDGDPIRVRILGEELVAFRDTSGRVGLISEWCPHRLTSMFLGRNEEDGLRCVYHGWKFDVTGSCVDMPNEPEEFDFKHKVKMIAYPTEEMGGVIWAYMGPAELKPVLPKFEFTQQPESHRGASKVIEECNWLQGLEGGIDSIHSSFLHRKIGEGKGIGLDGLRAEGLAGKLDVEPTDYGYRYTNSRGLPGKGQNYVRGYHFVMPHIQVRAAQLNNNGDWYKFKIAGHHWVPIDDHTTMVWNWFYSLDEALTQDEKDEEISGNGPAYVDPVTFRAAVNPRNNWLIDRDMQRKENFTGIQGVNAQDRAVQEAMGPIVNRSKEHLGQTDRAVIMTRRMLLKAVDTVADGGTPPGLGESYYAVRAIEDVLPEEDFGLDALSERMFAGAR
ncbi:MAG: Rieske 2Fe-2S domain-containing protein [Chloroflexi bacterium]|nr:Rieske 2Fe-2S domain-containing protein [Chloroflexota bacterium]